MISEPMRQIAKIIKGVPTAPTSARKPAPLILTRATISGLAVTQGAVSTTTIQLAGSSVDVPADLIGNYIPVIGDIVEVLVAPPRLLVLGPSTIPTPVATPTLEAISIIISVPDSSIVRGPGFYFTELAPLAPYDILGPNTYYVGYSSSILLPYSAGPILEVAGFFNQQPPALAGVLVSVTVTDAAGANVLCCAGTATIAIDDGIWAWAVETLTLTLPVTGTDLSIATGPPANAILSAAGGTYNWIVITELIIT
jgi:hypothetical protein